MITKIKLFFKKFWLKVVAVVAIPSAFAAGQLTGGTTDTLAELQSRLQGTGIELQVQAKVNKETEAGIPYKTAFYLTQDQITSALGEKGHDGLASDLAIQGEKLFTDWKAFVAEESKKVAPIDEPIKEQPVNEITK